MSVPFAPLDAVRDRPADVWRRVRDSSFNAHGVLLTPEERDALVAELRVSRTENQELRLNLNSLCTIAMSLAMGWSESYSEYTQQRVSEMRALLSKYEKAADK